jgi:hypothetical protein
MHDGNIFQRVFKTLDTSGLARGLNFYMPDHKLLNWVEDVGRPNSDGKLEPINVDQQLKGLTHATGLKGLPYRIRAPRKRGRDLTL